MGGGRLQKRNLAFFSQQGGFPGFQVVTRRLLRVSLTFAAGQRAARLPTFSVWGPQRTPLRPLVVGGGWGEAGFCGQGRRPLERERALMSLEARIRELSERHKRLDAAIAAELKHPAGDDIRVHELKRKKLRIKDEIAQLQTEPH